MNQVSPYARTLPIMQNISSTAHRPWLNLTKPMQNTSQFAKHEIRNCILFKFIKTFSLDRHSLPLDSHEHNAKRHYCSYSKAKYNFLFHLILLLKCLGEIHSLISLKQTETTLKKTERDGHETYTGLQDHLQTALRYINVCVFVCLLRACVFAGLGSASRRVIGSVVPLRPSQCLRVCGSVLVYIMCVCVCVCI